MTLRDPDVCPQGHHTTHVIRRERGQGCLRRRHRCRICQDKWWSFQTLLDPKRIVVREPSPAPEAR